MPQSNNGAIRIVFDNVGRPENPTLLLAKRNGQKIGAINAHDIDFRDVLQDASEMNFKVYKYYDDIKEQYWDEIKSLRLVWWKEQNAWYDTKVDVDESTETIKTVYCTQLGKSELSQINLYDIGINTEGDIEREDYEPSVLYNSSNPSASILNRILEKAPHYSIRHVDDSIKDIQRTFEFNDKSIYDSLMEIGEEIGCLFLFSPVPDRDADGILRREISAYDLQQYCNTCGYRGDFEDVCPICGSTDITKAYGEDTTIFVTSDELANEINLTEDIDSVKNCYKLEAGDDLMTATIRNCNPNGSDYIWYITENMDDDMSDGLKELLTQYNIDYNAKAKTDQYDFDSNTVTNYNNVVTKYSEFDPSLSSVQSSVTGYRPIVEYYYNTIDLDQYLRSTLMPKVTIPETSAIYQLNIAMAEVTEVSVANLRAVSVETASNAYKSMVNATIDARYTCSLSNATLSSTKDRLSVVLTITNKSYDEDTATSSPLNLIINDNYDEYVEQKVYKLVKQTKVNNVSVSALFDLPASDFINEVKKYCLASLSSFEQAGQAVIDLVVEQGTVNGQSWAPGNAIYDEIYVPYKERVSVLGLEIRTRETELGYVSAMKNELDSQMNAIRDTLNLENYLEDYWEEFCLYRREYKYSNTNYISDGLSNKEIFDNAETFISVAENEIKRSAESRFSISTTLNNLLHIDKFLPIVHYFQVGNWIRVQIDSKIFKMRLTEYTINFEDFSTINVSFDSTIRVGGINTDGLYVLNAAIRSAKELNDSMQSTEEMTEMLNNAIASVTTQADSAVSNAADANAMAADVQARADAGEFDGEDGESAFYIVVESSAGNIFKNRGINTTLTAHAYYGSTEVTDDVTNWLWEKHNPDGTQDPTWSRLSTNVITLTADDVESRAAFFVYATYDPEGV